MPVVALATLAAVATGCAKNAPQDTLKPEGPIARKLDGLWDPVFAVAIVIFVLVLGGLLVFAIRYRQRTDEDAPPQIHGNSALELGWTIVPAVLLAVIGVFTVGTIFDLDREPPGEPLQAEVIGHRFWWEYRYPEQDIVTANELHIPVGRPVRLTMTSSDVIHSFWPPRLAGKQDVVPGRTSKMTIQADKPGRYLGQCTEFCGESHANMHVRVVAHSAADFDEWVKDQQRQAAARPAEGDAAAGYDLFGLHCGRCHAIEGRDNASGRVGPDLTHLFSRTEFAGAMFDLNEKYLRRWLRNPPEEKPGAEMPDIPLTEDEITKLIAYLETLT